MSKNRSDLTLIELQWSLPLSAFWRQYCCQHWHERERQHAEDPAQTISNSGGLSSRCTRERAKVGNTLTSEMSSCRRQTAVAG